MSRQIFVDAETKLQLEFAVLSPQCTFWLEAMGQYLPLSPIDLSAMLRCLSLVERLRGMPLHSARSAQLEASTELD